MPYIIIGRDKIGREIGFKFELRQDDKGRYTFSMSADYWNKPHTDIIMGGQCCDEVLMDVRRWVTSPQKAKRMVEIWRRYHLNDMRAGCEHQRADNWVDRRIPVDEMPPRCHANQDSRGYLAIWIYPTEAAIGHFEKGAWVEPGKWAPRPEDTHPAGLLTKKCPVCGYQYGSAWLFEEIPAEIIEEIRSW